MDEKVQETGRLTPRGEEDHPALSVPEEQPAAQWAEKAQKAMEARALGLRLRKGKRLMFSSPHYPPIRALLGSGPGQIFENESVSLRSTSKLGSSRESH